MDTVKKLLWIERLGIVGPKVWTNTVFLSGCARGCGWLWGGVLWRKFKKSEKKIKIEKLFIKSTFFFVIFCVCGDRRRVRFMEVKFSSHFHEIMKFHSDEILLP
jgi:hypothetical protein